MSTTKALALALLPLLAGCSGLGPSEPPLATALVAEDHSKIADPRARWQAYGLADYVVHQSKTCYCAGPSEYDAVVRGGDVVALRNARPAATDEEVDLRAYRTVDELFDWIEAARRRAPARLDVVYHPRYGYPTHVDYDGDRQVADDEMRLRLSNLRRIVE